MTSIPLIFTFVVLVATVVIGLLSSRRAKTASDYWVAGRSVGVFTNASAISSNYLSAASFLGVAAFVWSNGFDGVWYATGFAAGYILLLLFIASPLRRFGKYTIPDFCQGRFDSRRLRKVGITWTAVISSLYIIAQMVGVGTLMESVTGLPWVLGVVLLGGVITLYVAFGGMTGVTLTQMIQFWIMLVAMIVPLIVLMSRHSYPELLSYALNDTTPAAASAFPGDPAGGPPGSLTIEGTPAFSGADQQRFGNLHTWALPFQKYNLFSSLSLIAALVCGTAGLPHILARFCTNPNAAQARWSTVWVLVFIGLFYITTPIWGAYARVVLGDAAVLVTDGKPNTNTMMLVTAEQAGQWAKALVAGGAIAALLSTVSGLLISLSSAFAHDLYGEILRPQSDDRERIVVAKLATLAFGILAIVIGVSFRDRNIAWMVGLAFSVAASTFFPLLVCGIWWRKTTEQGAYAGIMVGGLISAVVVVGTLLKIGDRLGIGWIEQPAIVSVPAAFIAIVVVSKLTYSGLGDSVRDRLDAAFHALHNPRGDREQSAA